MLCCPLHSLATFSWLRWSNTATTRASWTFEMGSASLEQNQFSSPLLSFSSMADGYGGDPTLWAVPWLSIGLRVCFLKALCPYSGQHKCTSLLWTTNLTCFLRGAKVRLFSNPEWVLAPFPWKQSCGWELQNHIEDILIFCMCPWSPLPKYNEQQCVSKSL